MDEDQFEARVLILVRIIESLRASDWPDEDKIWAISQIDGLIQKLKSGRQPRQIHGKLSL